MVGIIFGGGALKCVRLDGGVGLKYRFLPSFGDAIYFLRDAWDATVLRRLTLGSDSVATMLDAFSLCTDSVSDNGRSSDIFCNLSGRYCACAVIMSEHTIQLIVRTRANCMYTRSPVFTPM